jgi:hypothetical protein
MLCSAVSGKMLAGARSPPNDWDCSIGDGIAPNGVLCLW